MKRKLLTLSLGVMMGVLLVSTGVRADGVAEKPYLSLGADLNKNERKTVLALLGVDEDELDDYTVVKVTNKDEHDYLDDYLSASVIGSRALSSVLVEKKEEGHGIDVEASNITYCTKGMYQNALTTAGITDADVKVAGPFEITGTAALVGAMNAYEDMTGENITEESKDAATNELVVTSELADAIEDPEKAEQFLALVKEEILSKDLDSKEDIEAAVDEGAKKLQVELTEEQKQQILDLMEKIQGLDLDINSLKQQASDIYDKLSSMNLDTGGFFEKLSSILNRFLEGLQSLFG